ncbi:hypothetical protein A3D69_00465 [Candidatus Uhrbacteria bacterium RIFCSPHIGHO2_02_FULL_54_11]|nr:MAG: hypothetical protein A3D69_00465 [Candidatus Uhrbacteria bacterium RIFCSPHIGHO2_02_FULL_54_11]
MAPDLIQPGGTYQHYKGNVYKVIGVGKMEATQEDVVVYQGADHGSPIWVRSLAEFFSDVEWEGKTVPRFKSLSL